MSSSSDPDATTRVAAFSRLRALSTLHGGSLPWSAIREGFEVGGRKFLLASAAEGIFKPQGMSGLLSIKTVVPSSKGRVWYDDQRATDDKVTTSLELMPYSFKGLSPEDTRNRWLRDAMERQLPIIYFYGVAPAVYEPLFPVFVVGWHPDELSASLVISEDLGDRVISWEPPPAPERRYAMRVVKQRLHQAMFRQSVADAYGNRCALSGLPEVRLLDAAHIVPDANEQLGQPDVRNGILMSRIHHSAYDTGLLGIDPDYQIHIAESLLEMNDGPILESLKKLNGTMLRVPQAERFRPDKDRLAERYDAFGPPSRRSA